MPTPLMPERRVDKNGRLVTRHVKSSPSSTPAKSVPAPSVAQQYRVPPRDVLKKRYAGKAKSDHFRADRIRSEFGIPADETAINPVHMSDNEILDFMELGFHVNAAVEFKRWGITPEEARVSPLERAPVQESVRRMRALDLSPEEVTKIIRHGMQDKLLDKQLNDNELFGLLHEEKLNSVKYEDRSKGVGLLIDGTCTREDYRELGLENLGRYGGLISMRRKKCTVDYEVLRKAIHKVENKDWKEVPAHRFYEGWRSGYTMRNVRGYMNSVDKYGEEFLDLEHSGVADMAAHHEDSMDNHIFVDRFLTLAGNQRLSLTVQQKQDMAGRPTAGRGISVADYVNMLRKEGLTPEQTFHSVDNKLSLEQAREVHLNHQAASLLDGWL